MALVAWMSAGIGYSGNVLEERLGGFSRRSLSTQEILEGPEQALRCILFRDSNMNADDICVKKKRKIANRVGSQIQVMVFAVFAYMHNIQQARCSTCGKRVRPEPLLSRLAASTPVTILEL